MDEGTLALGIPYVAILMPVFIVGIIFFFESRTKKDRYTAMIEISKNIQDPSEIKDLLEDLQEKKKPIDYRRGGVMSSFVGLGLFIFGTVSHLCSVIVLHSSDSMMSHLQNHTMTQNYY